MGLFYFGLFLLAVIVGALLFISKNITTAPAVFLGLIALSVGMYLYLSAPVCSDYGTVSDLERNISYSGDEFFSSRTERVGNFIWNVPAWSRKGDRVITCDSHFQDIFVIH